MPLDNVAEGAAYAPRTVAVTLTTACNLSCAYCYQSHAKPRRMPWHVLRRALDLILESPDRDRALNFSGGETLLELPLMCRAVAYLRSGARGNPIPRLQISTNGLLLDRGAVEFLAEHRIHTQLSFDGVAPAQDVRAPDSFPVLDRLLLFMKAEYPGYFENLLAVRITLTSQNLPYLAESIGYLLERRVRDISIAPTCTPDPGWETGTIDELHRQLEDVFSVSLETYSRTGRVPLAHLRRSLLNDGPRTDPPPSLCGSVTGHNLVVDVDGSLVGCPLALSSMTKLRTPLLEEFQEALYMGSVSDDDLEARAEDFRRRAASLQVAHFKEEKHSSYARCDECRFLRECFVCPASIAHRPDPDPHRIPDIQCAMNLVALDHRGRFPSLNPVAELLQAQGQGVSGALGALLASAMYRAERSLDNGHPERRVIGARRDQ